jgi:hypothetical protein
MLHRRHLLRRRHRKYVWLAFGLACLFVVYFMMLTNINDDNKAHPFQERAHDANGVPIGP